MNKFLLIVCTCFHPFIMAPNCSLVMIVENCGFTVVCTVVKVDLYLMVH